jgi:Tyrosine phosphatase family
MTTRRVWIRRALLLGAAGLGAEQLWHHGHDYVFASHFVIVEPGKLYRGAWQKPWPMRRLLRNYKVKTILALAHPLEHALPIQERKLAAELGVKWIHIPIMDFRGTGDRDAEEAISDLLDQAAAVLADPANYPLYFHCHHGLNRASMVLIAYRTKYCGWTLAEASDEIERTVGLYKVQHGPDYRHMVSYYESRVLPLRKKPSQARDGSSTRVAAARQLSMNAPDISPKRKPGFWL